MEIKTVAVVGGGVVGSGIAIITAKAGLKTILIEKTSELAETALEHIQRDIDIQITRWGMTESEKKFILSNLDVGAEMKQCCEAQIVICAVPDVFEEQKDVLSQLNTICAPETIFSVSTAALSITELAGVLDRPEQMIGMHFLHPIFRTQLVEIVRGFATSDQTFQTAKTFIKAIGRTGIEVFESPGFVTTRALLPFLNEAMHILLEGVANAEDIDTALQLGLNMKIGPLELADRLGLDRVVTAMENLFRETGDMKFRPCPILKKLVRAKHFGVKTGQGFFTYDTHSGKKLSSSEQES